MTKRNEFYIIMPYYILNTFTFLSIKLIDPTDTNKFILHGTK